MEKNLIQSIKLEISKNFKLTSYERIAFHKILGILKTENGLQVLLKELYKEPLVRESAIAILKDFSNKEVTDIFCELLQKKISVRERLHILSHIERFGASQHISILIDFIETNRTDQESISAIAGAFNVLRIIGNEDIDVFNYFSGIAANHELDERFRNFAIVGLSSFKDITLFEELLMEKSEVIRYAVFRSMGMLCLNLVEKSKNNAISEEEELYTYSSIDEDRAILNVRVLLGKLTPNFDMYSNRLKVAFIDAMIACNHREFLIYTMKGLTSENSELIEMILYLLLSNVGRLRDPDKLLRNLIALSVNSERENRIIVEIFDRFFSHLPENRKNQLLKDKLYNYLVVTLETYFETYRKEFMITDVIEKDFPENFQRIRRFILERLDPELRKEIFQYLKGRDNASIHKLIGRIAEKVSYLEDEYVEHLSDTIDVFYDNDPTMRENSASRIENINFEKRYLRDRVLRICAIVGSLEITNAATILVKIFNYVKKYPDQKIYEASAETLSRLNYTYMLGELEVMLASGNPEDKMLAIRLLSQFSDQRATNILLDFLKEHTEQEKELIILILKILLDRDLASNAAAAHILKKKFIESNYDKEIRRLAILCLGKCGNESDIQYVNNLFFSLDGDFPKDAIVQAFGYIMALNANYNKRELIGYIQEYLKDPSIRVRIYSCVALIELGNTGALKSIQDMMIIKNKSIQREILTLVGSLKSVEFCYFIISLMKEDYTITNDIIAILALLPRDELIEVDHFIVNIFKKYEAPDMDFSEKRKLLGEAKEGDIISSLEYPTITVLYFDIQNFTDIVDRLNSTDFIMFINTVHEIALSAVGEHKGTVSQYHRGTITAYFGNPLLAAEAAIKICANVRLLNAKKLTADQLRISIHLFGDRPTVLGGEFLSFSDTMIGIINSSPINNKIVIDQATMRLIENGFSSSELTGNIFSEFSLLLRFYELLSPVNFLALAEQNVNRLIRLEKEREQVQIQIDAEIKKDKRAHRSPSTIAFTQEIDNLRKILRAEFDEINKYVQKRSTDRKMIDTVEQMLNNTHKRFIVESSKIIID